MKKLLFSIFLLLSSNSWSFVLPNSIVLDTTLDLFTLTGTGYLGLGYSENDIQGQDHYLDVMSQVTVTGSSTAGTLTYTNNFNGTFTVDSFFDVAFDINISDIDSENDFVDGIKTAFTFYRTVTSSNIVDGTDSAGNSVSVNFDGLVLHLGVDVNNNTPDNMDPMETEGYLDVIEFEGNLDIIFETSIFEVNHDFTAANLSFTGTGDLLGGVMDEYVDPPFNISMTSAVPEPTSLALLGLGLAGFGFSRKKKKT